jgi:hypothetical protein
MPLRRAQVPRHDAGAAGEREGREQIRKGGKEGKEEMKHGLRELLTSVNSLQPVE